MIFLTSGPAGNPKCGDIWRLKDGRFLLVDYKDPFTTGVTFSDGKRAGFPYTEGYASFLSLNEGMLITQKEWPWSEDDKEHPTLDEAIAFLETR